MKKEDKQLKQLLEAAYPAERKPELNQSILRNLPDKGQKRIYVTLLFSFIWGTLGGLLLVFYRPLTEALLNCICCLLARQLPSTETLALLLVSLLLTVVGIQQTYEIITDYWERQSNWQGRLKNLQK